MNIKMDFLGRGECSRRIKAEKGGVCGARGSGRKSLCGKSPQADWATLRWGLTQRLLFMFSDTDGNLCRSNQLLQVMLTMHRIIISSAELLQKVITLYPFSTVAGNPKMGFL